MNTRFLKSIFIFILLISSQPIMAQSITDPNIQKFLIENPSYEQLLESIDEQQNTKDINQNVTSQSRNVLNTDDAYELNLSTGQNNKDIQSISKRYFNSLTGEYLDIYGANEFNQPQDDELLFFNTLGKNYQLAPGDIIQVIITGLRSSNDSYQIMNDGTITLEDIYPLNVDGLNLHDVSQLILDKVLLDDASAKVFVRLNTARLVTVQVSGNVKSPRTIAVPAYTPLSRVIAYSGGVSDNGSLRNIILSQAGLELQNVDFYNFLQNPSPKNDPLIKSGARIFVPNKGSVIAATGFVNNPGIYELPNNESNISIKELLDLTGTSFFPSGATLKVSYFDTNGRATSRLVSTGDMIKVGEALIVDFVETRDLNTSLVSGAVLKDYEIKSNTPISIKKALKGGAVLSPDAFYQFALVNGKEAYAINLNDALINENIILPVGSDLRIYNKEEYLSLVTENPNKSTDPSVAKLVNAKNLAEIYLDGKRIAYVPISQNQNFRETLSNFYTPGADTIFDIALIDNGSVIKAIDLKDEIGKQNLDLLSIGSKLLIFENKFYNDLLSYDNDLLSYDTLNISNPTIENESEDAEVKSAEALLIEIEIDKEKEDYLDKINFSRKMLKQANLINIKLDGKMFTFIPFTEGTSSLDAIKKLRKKLPKLISEFVVVQNKDVGKTPEIKNLNYPFEISLGEEVNFISRENYRLIIKNYKNGSVSNLLSDLKSSNAVEVYYDGKLVLLLPPYYTPADLKIFEQYAKKSDLYKLYIGLKTNDSENGTWNMLTFGAEEFFSATGDLRLGPSNIVTLFSNSFIRNEFINDKANINGLNFNINTKLISQDNFTYNSNVSKIDNDLIDDKIIEESAFNSQNELLISNIEIMKNYLRTISGSVQFPGSYPVAKKIRLSNFLSTAGLITDTAKSDIIITEAINEKDRLTISNPKVLKLIDQDINNISLSGLYYIDVPLAINDAITGVIDIKGEVLLPGKYSFTRSETLQDIIKRAGGLSDVAFPLGAVLQRLSTKKLEKETNSILADQLEASILNLAQSSLEGAGDQVKVVLGYADQLRNQPTVGRMALNIMEDNPSNPIFLEDGDKLTIPKRPSHVSVVGSVQRSTVVSYERDQNFNYYLQVAGGLTKVADTRKAYLLLPNGESRLLKKDTVIPVGSAIIVPPKLDRLSILGGTDIVSKVFSNISNSILSVQNVD